MHTKLEMCGSTVPNIGQDRQRIKMGYVTHVTPTTPLLGVIIIFMLGLAFTSCFPDLKCA